MSFKRALISTIAEREQFEDGFRSSFSSRSDLDPTPRPQVRTAVASTPATQQQLRDALLGYSSASGYSAITDGLAYLDRVQLVTRGVRSDAITGLQGGRSAPSLKDVSADVGQAFVRDALGLGVIDALDDPALSERAGRYSASIFRELQAGTFTPALHYTAGKELAQAAYSVASAQQAPLPSSGVDAVRRSFEAARIRQQGVFFNDLLDFQSRNVDQNSIYGEFGMAPATLGRIPQVKVKFLFYCDIELWLNGQYQLMTVKACSGPEVSFVQDDVNHYGLRSKVNKSTQYGNLTLTLYDDTANLTASLFATLMSASTGSYGEFNERAAARLQYVTGSAELSAREQYPAVLPLNEVNGIVKLVRTCQVYVQNGVVVRDITTYINPKIVSLKKSELEMNDGTEASTITMEFAYDALNIEHGAAESPTWREERDRGDF